MVPVVVDRDADQHDRADDDGQDGEREVGPQAQRLRVGTGEGALAAADEEPDDPVHEDVEAGQRGEETVQAAQPVVHGQVQQHAHALDFPRIGAG